MSWHCVGPAFGFAGGGPIIFAIIPGMAARTAALSAAVGSPVPPRAFTALSSIGLTKRDGSTCSSPKIVAVNPPFAFASATSLALSALSTSDSPCRAGFVRSLKMRGELTIAACSGCASGTLMTSMRKSAELGSSFGSALEQPGSSFGERTREEPEM